MDSIQYYSVWYSKKIYLDTEVLYSYYYTLRPERKRHGEPIANSTRIAPLMSMKTLLFRHGCGGCNDQALYRLFSFFK